jgi:hypothetical protein
MVVVGITETDIQPYARSRQAVEYRARLGFMGRQGCLNQMSVATMSRRRTKKVKCRSILLFKRKVKEISTTPGEDKSTASPRYTGLIAE